MADLYHFDDNRELHASHYGRRFVFVCRKNSIPVGCGVDHGVTYNPGPHTVVGIHREIATTPNGWFLDSETNAVHEFAGGDTIMFIKEDGGPA